MTPFRPGWLDYASGLLTKIGYSDGTPDATLGYDGAGRMTGSNTLTSGDPAG
ncbi:hypothetical protein OIC43_12370 [Streptomyces sp. NBC_00825]|uniref:YD repeat-containing protein n=1 Tax=Streptomyces sanglieri TaxID=193460 RepID=A0ABW2WTA4_9ACTN|nr:MULTISPECIES: hypothetical protein [unclassified Streptomyces]WTB57333.1 hypothetical protein OG832_31320 [Streptomyces sp. NBC_00826]WTH89785.1 hypothetical protein OIC43_12370 [Streptomyces sp. NBC_00825]WTH98512.1 hypothetical protein OHA23_12355 [Streptomyces sp. NBC_00822]MCX4735375.1 hypothetical protein [Streptomyces sp. NBC_01363]MCX4863888.1 hypothetical protein [Streptomyces sp. NBC_00906]